MAKSKIPGLYWDSKTKKGRIQKQINGRELCKRFTAASWAEAERIYLGTLSEAKREAESPRRRTFREAATKYLDDMPEGAAWREAISLRKADPILGDLRLDQIHQGSVQRYIAERRAEGVKSATLRRDIAVIRRILVLASRVWRDEQDRPWLATAPLLQLPDWGDDAKPYPLTWEEQRRFFALLPAHLAEMALFAVNSGCREGVVTALRWDWEVRIKELDATVFLVPGEHTKNGTDQVVVLNQAARSVVESLRGRWGATVFEPVGRMNNTAWRKAWKAAGLPTEPGILKGPHNLRHTFARRLRYAGVPLATISTLMHHTDGNITVRYSPAEIKELLDAVERLRETESMTLLRVVRK